MPKKSTRPKAQDHTKPPSIHEAREVFSHSLIAWAWYLNSSHEERCKEQDDSYLNTILKNHVFLCDFKGQQVEGFCDPILHLQTHWLNMRAIDIAIGIGGALVKIQCTKGSALSNSEHIVDCVRELGLPSRHLEALSIFDLVNNAMLSKCITGEKYPGLSLVWRNMNSKGMATNMQVATKYWTDTGHKYQIDKIRNYIKNHKREWIAPP